MSVDVRHENNQPYKVQLTAQDDPAVSTSFDVSGKSYEQALALGISAAEDWVGSRPIAVESQYEHLGYTVLIQTSGPVGGRFRFLFYIFHKGEAVEGGFSKSVDDYISRGEAKEAAVRSSKIEIQRYY
ncbi:hypothetical protein [Pseudomonas sp.]|uniref:hypothetical protein n=1 Tax=Pseudomonas sp. TaxID=306 RepID=UPI00260E5879|nr:hypothetical protein [Pseudomonas sp.]